MHMYVHILPIGKDEVVGGIGHALAVTVSPTIRGPTSSLAPSTPPTAIVYVSSHSSKLSVTATI